MGSIGKLRRAAYREFIEERTFAQYFLAFFLLVISFGFLYSIMPSGHGIIPNPSGSFALNLIEGTYFSIVTISSLGYEDIQPKGFSRLLAGTEVVVGLALIGLSISKLASEQISSLVSSIFISEVLRNLDGFTARFLSARDAVERTFRQLHVAYEEVPRPEEQGDVPHLHAGSTRELSLEESAQKFTESVYTLMGICSELRDYLPQATHNGTYVRMLPDFKLQSLAHAMERTLSVFGQAIITLLPSSGPDPTWLQAAPLPKENLSDIIVNLKDASTLIASNSRDSVIQNKFETICQQCDDVSVALGPVPTTDEPDQLYRGDEPLE